MKLAKNPDLAKWHCSRCETWNDMEHGTCKTCGSPVQTMADAFRLRDTLSNEEKAYYETTVPMMSREIKSVRAELSQLHQSVTDLSNTLIDIRDQFERLLGSKNKTV